ncbi:hypothetical protein ACP70R_033573 [Stipagrostis hirtigluma subsp. patula]
MDGVQGGNGSIDEQGKVKEKTDISQGKTGGKWHRVWNNETKIDNLLIHASPLGKDRYHIRYGFFMHEGRFFVETQIPENGR